MELFAILFYVVPFLLLLLLGTIAGAITQNRHLKSLQQRETALAHILVTDLGSFPGGVDTSVAPRIVLGQSVVASDYLKTLLAHLVNLIGGEVRSFEILAVRARRESICRLLEEAQAAGCNAVTNLRLYTSDIGGGASRGKRGAPMAEVFACGTAYRLHPGAQTRPVSMPNMP